MFTGIVEEKGRVISCVEGEGSWRLKVAVSVVAEGVKLGDSIAVNGCCLTVVDIGSGALTFDVLAETLQVTNLKSAVSDASVNLERSLQFEGRIGGHFVTGHVDTMGRLLAIEPDGKDVVMRIEVPEVFAKYLAYKGCIAVDGISLTVARVNEREITIWLIPHTLEVTTLGDRKADDFVNLEFDLLAKYTERLLDSRGAVADVTAA